jgi:hypothetical protein
MKRTLMLLAAGTLALVVAGCALVSNTDRLAKEVCGPTQDTVTSLKLLQGLPTDVEAKLGKASDIVDDSCGFVGVVDVSSLKSFSKTAFPSLIEVVNATSWSDAKKQQIGMTLTGAQIVLNGIIASLDVQSSSATEASGVAAASASSGVAAQ